MEGTVNGTSQTVYAIKAIKNLKAKIHQETMNLEEMNISEISQKLSGIKHMAPLQREQRTTLF